MSIPMTVQLMRPVLEAHRDDGVATMEQLLGRVAEALALSPEDLQEQQPSGQLVLAQRLGWARRYLIRMGLIERADGNATRITSSGAALRDSDDPVPQVPRDWASKPLTRESVLAAIEEFDRRGRDEALAHHGYRRALDYVVRFNGQDYDAKGLYGVAYGIQYPDEEPIRNRGIQGGRLVNRRLTELGFQIESRRASADGHARVWLIRAGREGRYESLALDEGVCLIGWSDLGEIDTAVTRDQLKARIEDVFDEHRSQSVASQAGQVFRFIHEVQVGDLVVLPLMSNPNHVAIGRVTGDFERRISGAFEGTDAQYVHDVDWLDQGLAYERFDPDLREAFGQQGTVSEISKPQAEARLLAVIEGADASAIHVVLKWSPTIQPDTIDRHIEVAERDGSVWWGRQSKPGTTGLGQEWVTKLKAQLEAGSRTFVFLHSSAGTWRTQLEDVTTEQSEVDQDRVPAYYDAGSFHSLWVRIRDFEQVEPPEIMDGYVLASSGDPVTAGGLGNQTPVIIRKQSSTTPGRFFILNQSQRDEGYDDAEGERYHWTSKSSGATRQLASSSGARVVYYRAGEADDGTSRSYFASARIQSVHGEERDGEQHYEAEIVDFSPFDQPVPFAEGPPRTAQNSIQQITRAQFEKLLKAGSRHDPAIDFTTESIREIAEQKYGLQLAPELYAQLLAALSSGKHIILTGPPGTAKTTLAQVVAEAATAADECAGFVLTTATADWTTYETIGGLRPTGPDVLDFEEGHFLRAMRNNHWLVIDELNRSHFDRAFGQLFTVLSGQPVVLPYHRAQFGPEKPLALVPEGATSPIGADVLEIPRSWRVIATMNVFDKTLLFEMSFALMRRFAFIEVASPSPAIFDALIDTAASGEPAPASLTKQLLPLRKLKDLGPAVYLDLARFLRQRIVLGDNDAEGQLLFEAFYSYLLPQFEGIDAATGDQLFSRLGALMGTNDRRDRLRQTLNAVLGLELQGPPQPPPEVEQAVDLLAEPDEL